MFELNEIGYRTSLAVISHDGRSRFQIAGGDEGAEGVYLGTDLEGIYGMPQSVMITEHAFQIGGSYSGTRYPPRRFSFGVVIKGDYGGAWDRRISAWRKAWATQADSILEWTTPSSRRFLRVRLAEEPAMTTETDPNQSQIAKMVMSVVALDPRWYGDAHVIEWENPTDTTNLAPEAVPLSGLVYDNPGDFPTWPIYQMQASDGARYILPDYSWGSERFRAGTAHAARKLVMPKMIAGEHLQVITDEGTRIEPFKSSLDTSFFQRMEGRRFLYPVPKHTLPKLDASGNPIPNVQIGVARAPKGLRVRIILERPWTYPFGMEAFD